MLWIRKLLRAKQTPAIPGIGIEVLTSGPVLVLVLKSRFSQVLVLGLVLTMSNIQVLVLVLTLLPFKTNTNTTVQK